MKPNTLIIRAAGTNCDRELAHAFDSAGAATQLIHLNVLMDQPELLDRFDLLGVPGGFSYGDDVAAGKIQALLMKERLYPALRRCIERGVPIFAPCNGFQALVKMGLLPGPARGQAWPTDRPPAQSVTLLDNAGGCFIDRWVNVEIEPQCPCIWTQKLDDVGGELVLPIAHGEGRFIADPDTLAALEAEHFIALRYAEGHNVNGSMNRIAGICDASGLIFGLMPHPERFTRWIQHPRWTRLDQSALSGTPLGLAMFRNAVRHAQAQRV
ncbi:MAG: phosphoribosylformylglycinamidine synthase subunit PurQ [Phycisphaerales bacterium]|nr:phosphoribosylformylglycinamidine synthase subunit PurQ [Phycisphaerales bacterium]